jgi:pSer/pThr/pTyr-binding forkhead associated (FHA) protein
MTGMAGAGSVTCPACGASAIPGEAFCDNCGAALLPAYSNAPMQAPPMQAPQQVPIAFQRTASLVVTNPPPPATLPIPNLQELIVGRSDQQSNSYPDVDLGPYGGLDLGVSRRHFRLSRNGDQFYIEDLGSVNGTVVNGQRIVSHNLHPLRSDDVIALGKMEMRFEMS